MLVFSYPLLCLHILLSTALCTAMVLSVAVQLFCILQCVNGVSGYIVPLTIAGILTYHSYYVFKSLYFFTLYCCLLHFLIVN